MADVFIVPGLGTPFVKAGTSYASVSALQLSTPIAATGARILSQAAKELFAEPIGAKAVVSVCADGSQGTVALLERI